MNEQEDDNDLSKSALNKESDVEEVEINPES